MRKYSLNVCGFKTGQNFIMLCLVEKSSISFLRAFRHKRHKSQAACWEVVSKRSSGCHGEKSLLGRITGSDSRCKFISSAALCLKCSHVSRFCLANLICADSICRFQLHHQPSIIINSIIALIFYIFPVTMFQFRPKQV